MLKKIDKKMKLIKKKRKMPNKIFDANHTKKNPNFANLASKKPIWQP